MFDIGMTEMLVVGVVALIVVGPKDLPVMFRRVGQFVGKAMDGVKDATKGLVDIEAPSETTKLSAERAENVKRIQASTARSAAERKAREAQEAMEKADELEASLQESLAQKPDVKKADT